MGLSFVRWCVNLNINLILSMYFNIKLGALSLQYIHFIRMYSILLLTVVGYMSGVIELRHRVSSLVPLTFMALAECSGSDGLVRCARIRHDRVQTHDTTKHYVRVRSLLQSLASPLLVYCPLQMAVEM